MVDLQRAERVVADERLRDITTRLKAAALALQTVNAGDGDLRLQACIRLLSGNVDDLHDEALREEFLNAGVLQRHYLVGALYMLLMPPERRKRLAAFFTPPHLSEYVLDRLAHFGFEFGRHSLLDPACGGAAFLAPVVQRMAARLRAAETSPNEIIARVASLVAGVEIEPSLARLSQFMIEDVLKPELMAASCRPDRVIVRRNSLKHQFNRKFDAVVSNPPYGRVFRPSRRVLDRWKDVISDGHVNTYALFTAVALENLKEEGLAALIIPTSFTGGPYFEALRNYISREAEVLEIGLIEKREGVFLDVIQDTCVIFLRKKDNRKSSTSPARARVIHQHGATDIGLAELLPSEKKSLWILPRSQRGVSSLNPSFFGKGLSNLGNFGFVVRSGYFVWNRSRDRLFNRDHPRENEVPLIWAHNVKAGLPIELSPGPLRGPSSSARMSCVTIDRSSPALITTKSLILQRTTNRKQIRRLVAGIVDEKMLADYGALVSENHTIVISEASLLRPLIPIELLLRLLNSSAVDARFRQISGTVSISTKLLRMLPLPSAQALEEAVRLENDFEDAVELAYQLSGME